MHVVHIVIFFNTLIMENVVKELFNISVSNLKYK